MHLIFLNQYYPPDAAPTGLMLEAVCEDLAGKGHQVTVLCGSGGYAGTPPPSGPESEGHVDVHRIGSTRFGRRTFIGKLGDYLSYYLGVVFKLLTLPSKPDRIIALTTPPYLSLLARIFSKLRGADHAHWVMDLYPDVMIAHGMLKEKSPVHRLLAALTRTGFKGRRCAAILTLGPDMAERTHPYSDDPARTSWIPLWGTADVEEIDLARRQSWRLRRGWKEDTLVLLYSGNMGLGHRLTEFLEASRRGAPSVRFAFTGGGKRRAEIEAFLNEHPDAPVELHDYVPREDLAIHLAAADVHLASLEPSWDGTMIPSKLQGIFAVGKPVIFVGSTNCSIGRWIQESRAGYVIPPDDVEGLLKAIEELRDRDRRDQMGQAALKFADQNFSRARNVEAIAACLVASRVG